MPGSRRSRVDPVTPFALTVDDFIDDETAVTVRLETQHPYKE
jgi:hypothetical protein